MSQIEPANIGQIRRGEFNYIKKREPTQTFDENGGAIFTC